MKPSILVTGGAGYIGSHVVRQLSEAGRHVIVLDDMSTGSPAALIHGEELIEGNVGDEALLADIVGRHQIGAVVHFAASIVVPESVANPLKYYSNNTGNTLALLRACTRAGIDQFIFSSTAAVYGDAVAGARPVTESDEPRPANPYARSKLASEWILRDVARASPLRYVVLRYFNVAGADPRGRIGQRTRNATHLIKVACEAALGLRDGVTVFGDDYPTRDGSGVRDYIHVEDLAGAHRAALDHLERGGESLTANCGYGRGYTVNEVLAEVRRVSGVDFAIHVGPRRAGDVAEIVADPTLLKRRLGWRPAYADLREIVRASFEWERKMIDGARA
jgi:UDP-glucose 4-epimerase